MVKIKLSPSTEHQDPDSGKKNPGFSSHCPVQAPKTIKEKQVVFVEDSLTKIAAYKAKTKAAEARKKNENCAAA